MKGILIGFILSAVATAADADIVIDGEDIVEERLENTRVVIKNGGSLKLTSPEPFAGGEVELAGDDCSLILERMLPSEATGSVLECVRINGRKFAPDRDRIAIYGNGSEIIPEGLVSPLVIYDGENCSGQEMVCGMDVYYRGKKVSDKNNFLRQELLGLFDNSIRSFRLKRGYAAVFANNSDGTGYSRVFVAHDRDLIVDRIPEGLEFASFVRVSRADRIGKRGICGLDVTPLTRSAWYYSWGASDESQTNFEFIPMRHNMWWDGWDKIGSREKTSNVLAYNEPDHADQSDLSPDYAISEWPNFMKPGLRVGSPAPDAIQKDWLKRFIDTADSLNYRVDFVATHMYWNSQDPARLTALINDLCENYYGGRPMWITEWNNGANWTNEYWPTKKGTRRDAEFNVLLDENGNKTTVSRPHSKANSRVQTEWLGRCLEAFDSCRWLERHAFYNWVEDARAVVIEGKLTPAGKVFAEFCSSPAFSQQREHIHEWKIAPPFPSVTPGIEKSLIKFYDHNGETGVNYIIERRVDSGEWQCFRILEYGKDYKAGKTVNCRFNHDVVGKYEFRIKATSYKGEESIYSRIVSLEASKVGVDAMTAEKNIEIKSENGILSLSAEVPTRIVVTDLAGRTVRSEVVEGILLIHGLSRGLYLVNGYKIML